jgi:hypothetical protein
MYAPAKTALSARPSFLSVFDPFALQRASNQDDLRITIRDELLVPQWYVRRTVPFPATHNATGIAALTR